MPASKPSIFKSFKLSTQEWMGLLAIVLIGATFRLIGITWSLPGDQHLFSYHSNENFIVKTTFMLNIFSGKMEPNNFVYGTHFIYVNYFLYLIASALGLTDLTHPLGWAGVAAQPLYLMGRGLSVFYSLAYFPLLYFLGRNAFNRATGFLAVTFVALSPLLIYDAHFVTVDSCMTFWILFTFVLFTAILKQQNDKLITAAGIATGLAIGVKYVPFLLGFPALLCLAWPFRSFKKYCNIEFLKKPLRYGLACCLGFFLAVPYALISPANFVSQMRATHDEFHVQGAYIMFKDAGGGFSFFMLKNFPMALGWPLYICSLLGFFFILFQVVKAFRTDKGRDPQTTFCALLLIWVVIYIGFFSSFDIYFIRYLDPVAPFFCLFAAVFLVNTAKIFWAKSLLRPMALALITAVVIYTSLEAAARAKTFTGIDPRDQAALWIFEHAKFKETVALQNFDFFRSPSIAPPEIRIQENTPGERVYVIAPQKTAYEVVEFSETQRPLPDYFLVNFTFDWAPSLRLKDPGMLRTRQFVEEHYDLLNVFTNDMEFLGRSFQPAFDVFDWRYVNPVIYLYRLKKAPPQI